MLALWDIATVVTLLQWLTGRFVANTALPNNSGPKSAGVQQPLLFGTFVMLQGKTFSL